MKRPAYQFYPADHLQDAGVRACSLAARGLWGDMMCLMHQGDPYGHLTLPTPKDGGKDILRPILPPALARIVGTSREEVEALLGELEANGVYSRTADGVIYSRRMVRDERLREVRASGGHLSLQNPNVPRPKNKTKDGLKDTLPPSLLVSPSSSSSSASSSSNTNTFGVAASAALPAAVLTLPLNDGTEYSITQEQIDQLQPCYPAIDARERLLQARGWLIGNPKNRKTRGGIMRFVTTWLAKEQNRAPVAARPASREASVGTRSYTTPPAVDYAPAQSIPTDLDSERGREIWNAALSTLQQTVNRHSFDTWIKPSRALGVHDNTLYVSVPSPEFAEILGNKYSDTITDVICARVARVEFISAGEAA